jgi:hypothetical protein
MLMASHLRRGPNSSSGAAVAAVAVSDGDSVVSCSKIRQPLSKFAEPALRLARLSNYRGAFLAPFKGFFLRKKPLSDFAPLYTNWRTAIESPSINTIPGYSICGEIPGSICQACPRSVPHPHPLPPPTSHSLSSRSLGPLIPAFPPPRPRAKSSCETVRPVT